MITNLDDVRKASQKPQPWLRNMIRLPVTEILRSQPITSVDHRHLRYRFSRIPRSLRPLPVGLPLVWSRAGTGALPAHCKVSFFILINCLTGCLITKLLFEVVGCSSFEPCKATIIALVALLSLVSQIRHALTITLFDFNKHESKI